VSPPSTLEDLAAHLAQAQTDRLAAVARAEAAERKLAQVTQERDAARGNERTHREYAHMMQEQRSQIAAHCTSVEQQLTAAQSRVAAYEGAGIGLIAQERTRQISKEGWTPGHDDEHDEGQLAKAAACYALGRNHYWPWDMQWWKPTPNDRIRELAKAGALIAAEIDRLIRAPKSSEPKVIECGSSWQAVGRAMEEAKPGDRIRVKPSAAKGGNES
jgi:hypothetical protein